MEGVRGHEMPCTGLQEIQRARVGIEGRIDRLEEDRRRQNGTLDRLEEKLDRLIFTGLTLVIPICAGLLYIILNTSLR